MIVGADALFLQIPEHFEPAFAGNRDADDAATRLVAGLQYRRWHAIRRAETHALGLACANGGGELFIGFLDEFDAAGPGFDQFLQPVDDGWDRAGRRADGYVAARQVRGANAG